MGKNREKYCTIPSKPWGKPEVAFDGGKKKGQEKIQYVFNKSSEQTNSLEK